MNVIEFLAWLEAGSSIVLEQHTQKSVVLWFSFDGAQRLGLSTLIGWKTEECGIKCVEALTLASTLVQFVSRKSESMRVL